MPNVSRRPQTVYEDRVDFEAIKRAQQARHEATLRELRSLLTDIRFQTHRWVADNLARRKLKTAVPKFTLPRKQKWQALLRNRITAAAVAGKHDVARELGVPPPKFKQPDLTRLRARADVLFADQTQKLEAELKRVWSGAMFGNVDAKQLRYLTDQVFAEFAGWQPPEAP